MVDRWTLEKYRQLSEYLHGLQEIGPADEEIGNRLQQAIDELEEVQQLALRSRSKAAEGMRAARGVLKELGIAVPAMTRPPSRSSRSRPKPGSDLITYSAADAGPCISCGEEVGAGPVGWSPEGEPGPVCDDCLSARSPLSLVLMLANVIREIGEMEFGSRDDEQLFGTVLVATARHVETKYLGAWHPERGLPEERLFRLLEEIEERNERGGTHEEGGTSL